MADNRFQLKLDGSRFPTEESQHPPESEYPKEIVHQFAGGQKVVIGTQIGRQTLQVYNADGSSVVFYPDGSIVQMCVGKNVQYTKGGITLTIDENGDIVLKGHTSIKTQGGGHIEFSGDGGIILGGNTAIVGLGNLGITAKGNLGLYVDGHLMINAKQGMTFKTDSGSTQFDSAQNHNINAKQISTNATETIAMVSQDMNVNIPTTDWTGDIEESGIHHDSKGYHS